MGDESSNQQANHTKVRDNHPNIFPTLADPKNTSQKEIHK